MPLIDSLNSFRAAIIEANNFIALAFQQNAAGVYILPQNHRNFISDSGFLKIFIAWETFLENSFIQYMIGEPSILGNVVGRYVQPIDEPHASKILIGTQKYVDWANPEIVRRLCNLFLASGNPYDTFISSIMADLSDLKTVRNAAAHLSSTTRQQLDSVGTRRLKRPCYNLTVSDFIFAVNPDSVGGETILSTYLDQLDVCAEGIAKA